MSEEEVSVAKKHGSDDGLPLKRKKYEKELRRLQAELCCRTGSNIKECA
jgi:hypothetical protein